MKLKLFAMKTALISLFVLAPLIASVKIGVVARSINQARTISALEEGIAMAQADNLTHIKLEFSYAEVASCDGISGMRTALLLIQNQTVEAIFGSICYENCISSAQVTDYFNIPYFPLTCLDPQLDDPRVYRTSIRVFGSLTAFGWAFRAIYTKFGWKQTAIVSESGSYLCKNALQSIAIRFQDQGISVSDYILLSPSPDKDELQAINRIKLSARIIILCHSNYSALREVIFAAQSLNMTDPHTYVWITFYNIFTDFPYNMIFNPWVTETTDNNITAEELESRRMAFVCVKMLTFKNFTSISSIRDNINASRNIRINYFADIAYIYLKLRDRVLKNGLEPDGVNVQTASKLQTFQGKSESLSFDNGGDRVVPFLFWSMGPDGFTFDPMYELTSDKLYDYKMIAVGDMAWGASVTPPPDVPPCGFTDELCPTEGGNKVTIILTCVFVTIIIVVTISFIVKIHFNRSKALSNSWKINRSELEFLFQPRNKSFNSENKESNCTRNLEDRDLKSPNNCSKKEGMNVNNKETRATYRGMMVKVTLVSNQDIKMSHLHQTHLKKLKELQHDNLVLFVGAFVENGGFYFVVQHCSRGSLEEILHNGELKLECSFRISFLYDVIKGMAYLHKSFLNHHGSLSSDACTVTNRWIVQITGFGMSPFIQYEQEDLSKADFYKKQLWKAPEFLRSNLLIQGGQKGDVYSFAILAYEILTKVRPYDSYGIAYEEIVEKVLNNDQIIFRPSFDSLNLEPDIDPALFDLVRKCWEEDPVNRPTFEEIKKDLLTITKMENINIVDNMLDKLEKYAKKLEAIVQQRTEKLMEEKKKTDLLLHMMLPHYVAEELKAGRKVEPRIYNMATVYFSDIVDFTTLSSESSPMEIVDLLNDLYEIFDDTIAKHNVYKVETIGDAYMVVSGLPEETDRHVVEICNMALDLLSVVGTFKIKHRPDMMLMLRIGIHSGPCAAGVVGHTMPRFCLFGDTVNTASRMESTGEGLKIHLSAPAKDELMRFPGYVVELRGPTELKGKGLMVTYWLLSKETDAS